MNRVLSRLGLTAVSLVAGSALYAQSSTTGAVAGVVTDANGAPLAGASVTMTSAQVTRTAVTGADGSFRLGLLNPGTWSVSIAKDGYQTSKSTVLVNTNDVRGVNVKLPSTASATVDVVGVQSQVDVTSTTQGLQMNMEQMASVPKGRDMTSMAFFAPGVVDNGGTIGRNDPSISGASGAENSYVLDGLVTTDYRAGFQGAQLKTDFIDQVEVQTGGFRPEFSALGGVFNAVTKSGSNDFKGSAWITWDAVGIHAAAKKNAYAIEAAPNTRYDVGAEFGGAIIKDKLFYFVGVDADINQSTTQLPNNYPGLVGDKSKDTALQSIAKVNWYLTQDMQLTLFANYNHEKFEQGVSYPVYGNANLGGETTNTVGNYNISYDWSISPSLLLSAKLGFTDNKSTTTPSDTTDQTLSDANYFLPTTGVGPTALAGFAFRSGGTNLYQPLYEAKTTQAKVDLSWFVGNHNLKFGLSQLESKYTLIQQQGGPANAVTANTAADAGVLYPVNYSIDTSGRLNTYEEHTNATVKTSYSGMYAQDTWEIMPGFRLMYGARYEEQNLKDSSGNSFLKFSGSDYIQPRVGFTWDVNNDGKTKVAGSYATYFEDIPQQVSIRVFANEVYLRHRWSATAGTGGTNTNWTYTKNGAGAASTVNIINPASYTLTIDYATPFSYDPIATGTKLPQRQEYTLGADHTLDSGWTLGVHGKYRKLKHIIEDSVLTDVFGNYYDSGLAYAYSGTTPVAWAGQAILWNPGPGSVTWTARTSPNSLNSGQVINVTPGMNHFADPAGNQYESVDFTASKKTDRDFINFSYTWSRLQGNYEGLVSSSNGQTDPNITAAFDYYPYVGYGLLPLDRTNQVKLQYSHRFTVANNDLNVGFAWTYYSGAPLSNFDDGSATNGDPEGWDSAHNYNGVLVSSGPQAGGTGTGVITQGNYNNPANWTGGTIPTNGSNTGYIGPYNSWYDIGGYGNAVPTNGQYGNYGRTPAVSKFDLHLDYTMKFAAVRVIPSVDIFNLFNNRVTTLVNDQGTTQNGTANLGFNQENAWQEGRNFRFGVKVQF